MKELHALSNISRGRSKRKRVGRGPGSGRGKTSGRGVKGDGSRSGYKRRFGKEGGALPLFMKLPTRGFTRGRFLKEVHSINLLQIENAFHDGEEVNEETLRARGLVSGKCDGIKVLGSGEISKKITVKVNAVSDCAKAKLEKAGIHCNIV